MKKNQEKFWKIQKDYWKKQKAIQQKIEGQLTEILIQEDGTKITNKEEILNNPSFFFFWKLTSLLRLSFPFFLCFELIF